MASNLEKSRARFGTFYEKLVCPEAEALRQEARNGQPRSRELNTLEQHVWLMGWAEGAMERKARGE